MTHPHTRRREDLLALALPWVVAAVATLWFGRLPETRAGPLDPGGLPPTPPFEDRLAELLARPDDELSEAERHELGGLLLQGLPPDDHRPASDR